MKKALLALLLTAMASVHAAPISVTFTYEGANYQFRDYPVEWMPSAKLVASFTGEDVNGDNVITADELTSLYAEGVDYLASDSPTRDYHLSFSYRNVDDYSIAVGFTAYYDPNDGQSGWAGGRDASWSPTEQTWGWGNDGGGSERWTSTNETVASVVSSVPEPTTIAMLGIGLSVIGLSRRRSKGSAR
ncbi:PEP-CTERM sorting domain-containing protein [Pseudoduganella lutea]|uniref:PEP-CTERM sorting domain-containing protein n=1 Tax=Pseudoduganella lutea TaxID=321985 RepID=A0A4P6KV83_9BURK|nr:PEP-CTERM sorting domain-containing protein [Pseudoduganella lutea]QBE62756.1 PEP-CTERM sorting domain-containing protein [Pseudoduganella lutea]